MTTVFCSHNAALSSSFALFVTISDLGVTAVARNCTLLSHLALSHLDAMTDVCLCAIADLCPRLRPARDISWSLASRAT